MTLVNRTVIWRPSDDSQQPLTVCLPERPTHLQGPAGMGVHVFCSACTYVRLGAIMSIMQYSHESDALLMRRS